MNNLFRTLDRLEAAALASKDAPSFRLDFTDIALFKIDDSIGNACNGHRIGSGEHFVFADTDHQWGTLSRNHDALGLITADNGNTVAAF